MVNYKKRIIPVVLFGVAMCWNYFSLAEAENPKQKGLVDGGGEGKTQVRTSTSNGCTMVCSSPFQAAERLVESLRSGNLGDYLDCLTDESEKALTGGKKLLPAQILKLSEKYKEVGFSEVVLHSVYMDLDGEFAQITIVFSSTRGKMIIKERLRASIIIDDQGEWKIHKPTTDILSRTENKQ